jgi:O-methyltransferase
MLQAIKRGVKGALATAGYQIHRTHPRRSRRQGVQHSRVYPYATYSPWLMDEEFRRTYELVRSHTLVDEYRCYELWTLIGEVSKLAEGDLIEIGVWRGGTGCLIAKRRQLTDIDASVHLCDTFRGMVKVGDVDSYFTGGDLSDTSEAVVRGLLDRLDVRDVQIWRGVFPDETGTYLEGRKFRFCHVDVAVYQSAKDIFAWLWKRVVPGGLVVFDDYGFDDSEGIARLVEEERWESDRLVIHNLNGHAVFIKVA